MAKRRSCLLKGGHLGLLFTDNIHTSSAKNITEENSVFSSIHILHSFGIVQAGGFEGGLWIKVGRNFQIVNMYSIFSQAGFSSIVHTIQKSVDCWRIRL